MPADSDNIIIMVAGSVSDIANNAKIFSLIHKKNMPLYVVYTNNTIDSYRIGDTLYENMDMPSNGEMLRLIASYVLGVSVGHVILIKYTDNNTLSYLDKAISTLSNSDISREDIQSIIRKVSILLSLVSEKDSKK